MMITENNEHLPFDVISIQSIHYSDREAIHNPIKAIVVHCVGLAKLRDVIATFDQLGVSSHYLIPQSSFQDIQYELSGMMPLININPRFPSKAPVIQLVNDQFRAKHAGLSHFGCFNNFPGCKDSLNSCSIGIEFHTPGYANEDGSDWYKFVPYSNLQKETGIRLIQHLIRKHNISAKNILAHSTIAPNRKTDPGPLFFWEELYKEGLGYLPFADASAGCLSNELLSSKVNYVKVVQERLLKIGFLNCPQDGILNNETQHCIDAFIMQFASQFWQSPGQIMNDKVFQLLINFDVEIYNISNE